jgi:hypothetical protein
MLRMALFLLTVYIAIRMDPLRFRFSSGFLCLALIMTTILNAYYAKIYILALFIL